jgi:diketogulonate reductase-like aldo/keto reductase
MNQIECHPLLTQQSVVDFNRSKNIVTEAWSPLMRGSKVLDLEVIRNLAEKYQKTPAQIILNWDIRQGIVPIPKSANPLRIAENYQALDFALSEEDLLAIDALNQNERSDVDPGTYAYCK